MVSPCQQQHAHQFAHMHAHHSHRRCASAGERAYEAAGAQLRAGLLPPQVSPGSPILSLRKAQRTSTSTISGSSSSGAGREGGLHCPARQALDLAAACAAAEGPASGTPQAAGPHVAHLHGVQPTQLLTPTRHNHIFAVC